MAFGALEYCRANAISVPSDLSIVGFDDVPTAALVTPRLTTSRQPAHDLGSAAAGLLFALIDDEDVTPPKPFPTTLMVRESVAPPAR
jgi:LacI family transcriptional regulator